MGQHHLSSVAKFMAAEAKGKYAIVREMRHKEDERSDQRFNMVLKKDGSGVASVSISTLPGCCGVGVIHNFSGKVNPVLDLLHSSLSALKRAKYGQAMFTFRSDSEILRTFLSESVEATDHGGAVTQFINGKTGNSVTAVQINLRAEAPTRVIRDTEGE